MEKINLRIAIAARLREERERVEQTSSSFAQELGISPDRLRQISSGRVTMNTEQLAQAARLGVDVQYVVTGVRSNNLWDEVYVALQGWPAESAGDSAGGAR